MLQRQRLETRSLYRSVRYRVNRDQFTRTADPSACTFRIKKNSLLQTMAQTIDMNPLNKQQSSDLKDFMKMDCLQSFHSMMERTDRKQRIKIRFNRQKQHSVCEDRVTLPNFAQNQKQVSQSQHSLLTPIHKPYNHVKLIYLNCQNQLKSQKNQCQQIRHGLKHIKQSKLKQLSEIQTLGKDHLTNIMNLLRKNEISQQQKKLKTKRQIKQLEEDHQKSKKFFEAIDLESTKMQINIFNSTPFNLKQRGDQKGQIYF